MEVERSHKALTSPWQAKESDKELLSSESLHLISLDRSWVSIRCMYFSALNVYESAQRPLPHQKTRQRLSANLRPLHHCGFFSIKLTASNEPFTCSVDSHVCHTVPVTQASKQQHVQPTDEEKISYIDWHLKVKYVMSACASHVVYYIREQTTWMNTYEITFKCNWTVKPPIRIQSCQLRTKLIQFEKQSKQRALSETF